MPISIHVEKCHSVVFLFSFFFFSFFHNTCQMHHQLRNVVRQSDTFRHECENAIALRDIRRFN